jgi:3-dehydroquinate synthase
MFKSSTIQTSDYSILLGVNAGNALDVYLETKSYSKLFVLMDENTYAHCYPVLSLDTVNLLDAELLVIDPGEENKSIEIAAQLWESLTEAGADRHSLLINLGGGILSDLGGFVASSFKRGMDFINIPTSLLAMVDASIGGKTGINLGHYKNQVGLFSTPKQIIIDERFLKTLPQEQILSAYAEMLKHGLIKDEKYWEELSEIKQLDPENLIQHIEKSIQIKKQIVDQDPTEKGLRKALNYGHSIGHAVESFFMETNTPLSHGESVAVGMLAEAYLSKGILKMSAKELERIDENIRTHYAHIHIDESQVEAIADLVMHDKKKEGNHLNFSLLKKIGQCEINVQVTRKQIEESIKYIIYGFVN